MNDENNNGWTNRETGAVMLWIANDAQLHNFWKFVTRDILRTEPLDMRRGVLARKLEEDFHRTLPYIENGLFTDLLSTALRQVNWPEIAQSMLDDEVAAISPENDADFTVIYSYSRAQAIADGVLVDVSGMAKEAGFKLPVALTAAAWETCVRIPDGVTCQDETGRLWDVLNVLLYSIRVQRNKPNPSEIRFTVSVRNSNEANQDIDLKAICSPGDDAEPVVTIMLPDED